MYSIFQKTWFPQWRVIQKISQSEAPETQSMVLLCQLNRIISSLPSPAYSLQYLITFEIFMNTADIERKYSSIIINSISDGAAHSYRTTFWSTSQLIENLKLFLFISFA